MGEDGMSDEKPVSPFVIDENDLAGEWLRQPQLMRRAGRAEAEARLDYAQAKAQLDVVRARLYLDARNNPAQYELRAKPTLDEIEAAVELHTSYQAALNELNQAEYYVNLCKADTTAMIDRRKALESRVELLALNYFAEKEPHASTPEGRDAVTKLRRKDVRGGGYDDV